MFDSFIKSVIEKARPNFNTEYYNEREQCRHDEVIKKLIN